MRIVYIMATITLLAVVSCKKHTQQQVIKGRVFSSKDSSLLKDLTLVMYTNSDEFISYEQTRLFITDSKGKFFVPVSTAKSKVVYIYPNSVLPAVLSKNKDSYYIKQDIGNTPEYDFGDIYINR